ncbi:MAG: hypothetical protein HY909_06630 [Deltaproteobacteria bacterium]|nr:hypothetical protein [Deltaproteobacteria bacterium]
MAPTNENLAKLRQLLQVHDAASLKQAVELARSLEDRALWDALLQGVTWKAPESGGAWGVLDDRFPVGSYVTRAWRRLTLSLLVGASPDGTAGAALRAQVTSLSLSGTISSEVKGELDLSLFGRFQALETLRVEGFPRVFNFEALARLPALKVLVLFYSGFPEGLGGLAGCEKLERLDLSQGPSLAGVLQGLPALRELNLEYPEPGLGLAALKELRTLEVLQCNGFPVADFMPLAGLRALRRVQVSNAATNSLRGLEGCTSLEVLNLSHGDLEDLEPLRGARALKELYLPHFPKLTSLEPLRGLTTLRILDVRTSAITDVDPIADCALESFHWDRCGALTSLAGLRGTRALTSLQNLYRTPLRSLDGLENLERLERINLADCPELASIAALRGRETLVELALLQAAALTTLDGLQGCHALTTVNFHCSALTDLSALEGLKALSVVNLAMCKGLTDLSVLTTLPQLKALGLYGTNFKRGALPPALRAVATFALGAKLHDLAAKPRAAPRKAVPTGVPEGKGRQYLHIRKLLLARDEAQIDQGLELLRALGEPSYYDVLLRGVTWSTERAPRSGYGTFQYDDSVLRCPGPAKVYRQRLVLGLLATAPDTCEAARDLKDKVTNLVLWAPYVGKVRPSADLAPLAALPKLERLAIQAFGAITHPETFGRLPTLRALELQGLALDSVPLEALGALESLTVHCDVSDLSGLPSLRNLKVLQLASGRLQTLPTLAELPNLETVTIQFSRVLQAVSFQRCLSLRSLTLSYLYGMKALDLTGCAALETLVMQCASALESLKGLNTLTSLKRLNADVATGPCGVWNANPVLPSLEALSLATATCEDTDWARGFPALKSLTLRGAMKLKDLSGLAALPKLESLDLRGCAAVRDLSPLEALLNLRTVELKGTVVDRKALPKRLQRIVR